MKIHSKSQEYSIIIVSLLQLLLRFVGIFHNDGFITRAFVMLIYLSFHYYSSCYVDVSFQYSSPKFHHIACYVNRGTQQNLLNLLGAIYASVFFLGATNSTTVQSIVAIERTVFYRERAAGMYSALPYAFAQVNPSTLLTHFNLYLYFCAIGSLIFSMSFQHRI